MFSKIIYTLIAPLFNLLYYVIFRISQDEAGMGGVMTLIITGIITVTYLSFLVMANIRYYRTKRSPGLFLGLNLCFVIYMVIVVLPDISGCGLARGNLRDVCLYRYASRTNNVRSCEIMDNSYSEKSRCFENLATYIQSCEHITEEKTKSYCLKATGISNNNIDACKNITVQLEKDWCYEGLADKTYNPELCELIANSWPKNSCYIRTARSLGELDNCDKINKEDDKYKCIRNIAKETKDKNLCELVVNTKDYTHKDYCLNGL